MIYQLYQKQVEAWKERFGHKEKPEHFLLVESPADDLLLSRHKDTIELIEAEIERKRGLRRVECPKFGSFCLGSDCPHLDSYNSAIDEDIAYLEEQIKLIKKEQ